MGADSDPVLGCLLGLAVGDALGLPREGLSPGRGGRLFPHLDRHQFFFRRGLFSDDTEHACLTAQALLASGGDPATFRHSLARRLRWWFAALPAGIGKATFRACLRLWLGFSPDKSGVPSAGNGPAMRAPLLGVCLGSDPPKLGAFVRASTRLTHTDPRAEYGAFAVAWAAHRSAETRAGEPPQPRVFTDEIRSMLKGDLHSAKLFDLLDAMVLSLELGQPTERFADTIELGRGVSGYMYHTVPVAFHAWLSHPGDYRAAVQAAIRCGGDTDTVAAITGALVGARVGKAGIPPEWLAGVIDWPRSVRWVGKLAARVSEGKWRAAPQRRVRIAWWAIPFRNLLFLVWVLKHGFRRLLPPY
jgi:ADP-ribosylglycohydrolase